MLEILGGRLVSNESEFLGPLAVYHWLCHLI